MPTTTVALDLAGWICDPDLDIPEQARRASRLAILDTIGTTVGARRSPDFDAVRFLAGEPGAGRSTLIGRSGHLDAPRSAFVNAYTAHLLDFDDSSGDMAGHPTAVVFPAALAVATDVGSSGRELLDAYLAGVEVSCLIGRAVNPSHYDSGWHPSATLGGLGAAAAAARLLGLSASETASALGLAIAFANGVKASFGTPAKALQVARASESGVLAAYLVRAGAYSREDAFEHHQGFFKVFDDHQPGPLALDMSEGRWSILHPGIIIKQYPCCGSTHSAIEAARALAPLASDDVAEVRIALHPRRRTHVDRPAPTDALDAKFSVQYTVARALLSGSVTLDDFTPDKLGEPGIRSLLACTVVDDLDAPGDRFEDRYGASVALTLVDGSRREQFIPVALGRAPGEMLEAGRIVEKFHTCANAYLGRERADELANAVDSLDVTADAGSRLIALSSRR